ncbi:transcription initiation factor TFIID subunit 1-like [Trifolium medium]|uniref:Transcription initiation factor TFIID subunit 1-like n=1 Tax=Trifolium medium TaxID=97028 RepID=A0A392M3Y3_9FABA|nr:transcription initiation factor TFIID subunit 1-like [Trifolium medium]
MNRGMNRHGSLSESSEGNEQPAPQLPPPLSPLPLPSPHLSSDSFSSPTHEFDSSKEQHQEEEEPPPPSLPSPHSSSSSFDSSSSADSVHEQPQALALQQPLPPPLLPLARSCLRRGYAEVGGNYRKTIARDYVTTRNAAQIGYGFRKYGRVIWYVLLKFNVPQEAIANQTREKHIAMIRKLSSEQAASGVKVDPTTMGIYAREGNSGLDFFAGDLENLLDGVKGLNMRRHTTLAQTKVEIEDEEAEAAELHMLLMDGAMVDASRVEYFG